MGRPLSDLRLRPSAGATPGQQLERRLAVMVREGRLAPGRRLPSTRWLASRLGVHRNTVAAAHRRLAERGLLVVRHGTRSRVPRYGELRGPPSGVEPHPSVAEPDEPPAGRAQAAVAACRDPATARLMEAELSAALGSAGLEAEVRAGRGAARLAVALPGPAASRLAADGSVPLIVAHLDARRAAGRALRRAPPLAVVALLTRSRVLREAVLADADRLRPGEVTVRPADPRGAARVLEAAEGADLVIADALAAGALWDDAPPHRARLVPLRLLSPGTLETVVRRLGGTPGGRPSRSTNPRPSIR